MKKINLIIGLFVILLSTSCNRSADVKKRVPNSVAEGKIDLIENARFILDEVGKKAINAQNCEVKIQTLATNYFNIRPDQIDATQMEVDGKIVLDEMFNARVQLHTILSDLPNNCRMKMKDLFLAMRMVEDTVGILHYKVPQISADQIKYQEEKIPVFEKEAYYPYHTGAGINPSDKFEFKNGDIMITKGISFVSSTISEIASPQALFSHIVFVHVNEKTKEVSTIESYVGKGVEIYPIEVALKNENARILVLRPKDSILAQKAANYMYDRVMSLKAVKKFIPYDYKLDFSENTKLSCEEVAFDSFKTVSNGQFIIPEMMSDIKLKDDKFLDRIGIKKGKMMVPADMETDSRFDIALDWTDYRVMRDSWRKDAVLSEMFRWSDDYNYSIKENFTSVAARIVWSTRFIPGVWNMMAKVSGLPVDFTKDVPSKTIATMASLKSIGTIMLPEVAKADEEFFKSTGSYLSASELRSALNKFRETHPKDLEKVYRAK